MASGRLLFFRQTGDPARLDPPGAGAAANCCAAWTQRRDKLSDATGEVCDAEQSEGRKVSRVRSAGWPPLILAAAAAMAPGTASAITATLTDGAYTTGVRQMG